MREWTVVFAIIGLAVLAMLVGWGLFKLGNWIYRLSQDRHDALFEMQSLSSRISDAYTRIFKLESNNHNHSSDGRVTIAKVPDTQKQREFADNHIHITMDKGEQVMTADKLSIHILQSKLDTRTRQLDQTAKERDYLRASVRELSTGLDTWKLSTANWKKVAGNRRDTIAEQDKKIHELNDSIDKMLADSAAERDELREQIRTGTAASRDYWEGEAKRYMKAARDSEADVLALAGERNDLKAQVRQLKGAGFGLPWSDVLREREDTVRRLRAMEQSRDWWTARATQLGKELVALKKKKKEKK